MQTHEFIIKVVSWKDYHIQLGMIRRKVFIEEQQVPEALEWDGMDEQATHLLAVYADGQAIGTTRLLADGQIGRMAVLAEYRNKGVGKALMHALLDEVPEGRKASLFLNAQTSAQDFYTQLGFVPSGDIFEEAGIPHVRMIYAVKR